MADQFATPSMAEQRMANWITRAVDDTDPDWWLETYEYLYTQAEAAELDADGEGEFLPEDLL